jgi:hypothetical protein
MKIIYRTALPKDKVGIDTTGKVVSMTFPERPTELINCLEPAGNTYTPSPGRNEYTIGYDYHQTTGENFERTYGLSLCVRPMPFNSMVELLFYYPEPGIFGVDNINLN